LVASLANAGAVLLPYSYASGTGVTESPTGVQFSMAAYSADDSKQPIATSIANLDSEITSLRTVWQNTPIVLVGHSYGGLVAEEWWQAAWANGDHKGVAHVFSLDAPINGVFQCNASAHFQGQNVSDEFCLRRASLTGDRAIDNTIIRLAADGSFTAVGNPDDPTYTGLLNPLPSAGGGIEDQVVYKCGDRGDRNIACVASPPSLVINAGQGDTTCMQGDPKLFGTKGHDLVKACSFVVDAIVAAVNRAKATSSVIPTTTSAPSIGCSGAVCGSASGVTDPLPVGVSYFFHVLDSTQGVASASGAFGLGSSPFTSEIIERATVMGHPLAASDVLQSPSSEDNYLIMDFTTRRYIEADVGGPDPVHVFTGQWEVAGMSATFTVVNMSPADAANAASTGVLSRGRVEISYILRARSSASIAWSDWSDHTFGVPVQSDGNVWTPTSSSIADWPPQQIESILFDECHQLSNPVCIGVRSNGP